MPDEPLYDPDRSVPEDLDFTDPEVARAYLDHPVTEKLGDDIGRLFRGMSASDQHRALSEYLTKLLEFRAQATVDMADDLDSTEHPLAPAVLDDLDKKIEAARRRMLELDQ